VHADKRGGIIASGDSSIYNYGRDYYSYVWPRDGAYAIWPLIRLGYREEPKRFFEFCRDILTQDGYLMHKYQPDRAIGSTWHPLLHGNHIELPIQEDETAVVIYMLGEYFDHTHDEDFVRNLYGTLIQPAANFMADFIDPETNMPHASYDLWEEKFLTNTYTAALVYQSLLIAADFAERFEHPDDALRWRDIAETLLEGSDVFFDPERKAYRKGYLLKDDNGLEFDNTLDVSSLYGVMMFGLYKSPDTVKQTAELIEQLLLDQSPSGGTPRYEHDRYFESTPKFMGNPWFVTTLWLAQYYVRIGEEAKARQYLDWALEHALPSGALSEQINPKSGEPVSVTPLVWSHAELINTLLDITHSADKRP
jgi:GH15 family glucan-1,4-alpha-glucosidase